MANRCPSCGGTLKFDVSSQKLICEYCDSVFDPEAITGIKGAGEFDNSPESFDEPAEGPGEKTGETAGEAAATDEQAEGPKKKNPTDDDYEETTIFTCPNCGGEVASSALDAVDYCKYCGSFVTLNSRIERLKKPELIMPFKVTKEQCLDIYETKLRKSHFVPSALKRGDTKAEFRQMYIPFWDYSVEYPEGFSVTASESWSKGNYDYDREYQIDAKLDGPISNCLFDASSTLDDRISKCIGDYDEDDMVEYNPSYMMGSYGDIADVPSEIYVEEASNRGIESLVPNIGGQITGDGFRDNFHDASDAVVSSEVRAPKRKVTERLAMLPVWFMTYRKNDRVAYSVINGQTGSVFAEVPVDVKKYVIFSLILAIPIFAVLEMFLTMRPTTMLGVVCFLTAVILCLYSFSVSNEMSLINREDDAGFNSVFKRKKKKEDTEDDKMGPMDIMLLALIIGVIVYIGDFFLWLELDFPLLPFRFIFVAIAFFALICAHGLLEGDEKKGFFRETMPGVIGMIISVIFAIYDPVNDAYYYLAAAVSIIGIIASSIGAMNRYNRRLTHPIPRFFKEKKGEKL
ncbi:MAG: hypothetical protein K5840_00835 [Eubacterium sp.]|nr:hypothetical protein [Eubacterium sp.]